MARMFAFLRGINLGGHTVTNVELAAIFKKAGVTGVETFIASGNLIFDAPKKGAGALQKKLESALEAKLGYAVPTFLRSESELVAIARHTPFKPARHKTSRTFVIGLLDAPMTPAAVKELASHNSAESDFAVNGREVYWLCQVGQSESAFFRVPFDRRFKVSSTWRNINTLNRLIAKYKLEETA